MSNKVHYEAGLSLIDVISVIKIYRRSILIAPPVVTLIIILFSVFFIEPCYKAYGVIQVGQVDGKLLESGFVLEERMKDMSFISQIIGQHREVFNDEKDLAAEEKLLKKGLEVKKNKDTDLVSFSLLSHTPQSAIKKSLALIDTLNSNHNVLLKTHIDMVKHKITLINQQIEIIQRDQQKSQKGLSEARGLNSYNAVVDALVIKNQATQLRELMDKKIELESGLNPAVTFNTKLLGDIYVSNEPVSPNLQLMAIVGFLITLFGTVFIAFVRDSLTREN